MCSVKAMNYGDDNAQYAPMLILLILILSTSSDYVNKNRNNTKRHY